MYTAQVRTVGAALLVVGLAACTSVGMVSYPAEYISMRSPGDIWITRGDDPSFVEIRGPTLHGDTLAGFDRNGAYLEMPITDVKLMKARAVSPTKTAILVAGAAVGSAIIISQVQGSAKNCVYFVPAGSTGSVTLCPKDYGNPNPM